ncbi:hypothetical protein DPMN_121263 [Dreissena polymorpha]|uniref:Uncharacterized protein n=1 Tax=Dreissena polymorpha TaxID=45954 RepID=A0A9D4GQF7_DREPO|nr:hypothetical protein DPMN_121263 [Dreissena polymorpha]
MLIVSRKKTVSLHRRKRDGYRGTGSVEDERGRDTGQDFEVMAYEDNGSVAGRRYPVRSMC